jgi:hypothetical protein
MVTDKPRTEFPKLNVSGRNIFGIFNYVDSQMECERNEAQFKNNGWNIDGILTILQYRGRNAEQICVVPYNL